MSFASGLVALWTRSDIVGVVSLSSFNTSWMVSLEGIDGILVGARVDMGRVRELSLRVYEGSPIVEPLSLTVAMIGRIWSNRRRSSS